MDPNGYRLYIDESGDHTFKDIALPTRRYLCILGCWFRNEDYRREVLSSVVDRV